MGNVSALPLLPLLLALALAGAIAAGCNGDEPEPPAVTQSPSPTATRSPQTTPPSTPEPTPTVTEPPATPTGDATPPPGDGGSDLLRVVDKQTALPAGYVPPNLSQLPAPYVAPGFGGQMLRQEALEALARMLDAADAAGHDIRSRSAYRSYSEQERTFAYWVSVLGEAEARRVSAEPGHSEHQLGTAADLTSASAGWELTEGFAATAEGEWLAAHAHEYGFALSYPQGAEAITGYKYEPWHYRYIGPEAAQQWNAGGLTLIEFLRMQ